MRIAFLGLGRMGAGMAANLAKAQEVIGFDPVPAARAGAGVATAQTLQDALAGAEAVVSMLPAGAEMRAAFEGVFAHAAPGATLMDCSTIDVETARAVTKAATEKGFAMVDAPVSGGVAAAQAGTLTFMVGGEEDAFARARPILQAMGKAVIHAGASGAGQAAKICNNMLLAISMIGTCEAFALAGKLGLDAAKFFEIASQSSGQCWSMTAYAPVPGLVPSAPSNRGFEGGFLTSLMLKDLRLAHEAAASVDAQTPLGAHALDLYERFAAVRGAERDFSSIIEFLRD
jgi:3-hydroxyisobutyrate dehydrogenase